MPSTVDIWLPKHLRRFVEHRVKNHGFGSSSEYFQHLIRRDAEAAQLEELGKRIREGLESPLGPSWEDLQAELSCKSKKPKPRR